MLTGAGLTYAGENVPLTVLMRDGGNWREPSVLPAASSSLSLGLAGSLGPHRPRLGPPNVSKINSKTASESHRFTLNYPTFAPYS
jgi:hypothetical protein